MHAIGQIIVDLGPSGMGELAIADRIAEIQRILETALPKWAGLDKGFIVSE